MIDNVFIGFENVKLPKSALLNKLGNIDEEGNYHSDIKSYEARFGLQLGALSQSRIAISRVSSYLNFMAANIAIRYACMRQQFYKPKSNEEYYLIDFKYH